MHEMTSIIILNCNTLELLEMCIESIRAFTKIGTYEIIVIDNVSADDSVTWLHQQNDIRCVFNEKKISIPKIYNQGIALSKGDSILLMNSDIIVTPRWLEQLKIALYSSDDIGAVSCVTNDGDYQKNGLDLSDIIPFAEKFNHSNSDQWMECSRLPGSCMLFKRKIYNELGGIDKTFISSIFEQNDYSSRIHLLGYRLLICKDTFVYSFTDNYFLDKQHIFMRKCNLLNIREQIKSPNHDKITFITMVNNEELYDKAVENWKKLNVPRGMQVDYIAVRDAISMTDGCNSGMVMSDAKYKIYVHQDVFFENKNFLNILINSFRKNKYYGIAGVVGCKDIPRNGVWWESKTKIGGIRDTVSSSGIPTRYFYQNRITAPVIVSGLDGLILATQYDIPWRSDLFDKWHFYDMSQCMEFRRHGYKAIVLPQLDVLCFHDCGVASVANYNNERIKFLDEYAIELNN